PKAGLDVSQGRDVSRPYGRFKVPAAQAKVLEANKRQDISDDLERLPPDIFGDGAMPAFRFEPGVAAYFPRSNSIRLNKNPKAYHGSIGSARHEVGHGVHYNKGILTDDFVADSFKAAADQDLALLKSSGVYTKLLGHPMATQGRELIDHVGLNLDDPELSEKMGGIFDTVGGLTKGKIGMGHTKKYYREKNNGLMEAFANAFEAVLSNDDLYKKQFPNLAHYMEELIQ
ncbi:MAG: hypothetical protein PF795_04660, partial [Kiritimatiellae bacterium]|nr:hypothetical protein [Kiritimatiellia bacterium]